MTTVLTAEEAEIYDRQIRLWGIEAQQSIRKAKVLLIGVNGVSGEIAKNLILAGIGHLTLLDATIVEEKDLGTQFFLRKEDVGHSKAASVASRVKVLNPNTTVTYIHANALKEFDAHHDLLKQFDFVVTAFSNLDSAEKINEMCRNHGVKFYLIEHHGMFGMFFCDLIRHEYMEEKKVLNPKDKDDIRTVATKKEDTYCSLSVACTRIDEESSTSQRIPLLFLYLAFMKCYSCGTSNISAVMLREHLAKMSETLSESVSDEIIAPFANTVGSQFTPICAILGGVVAQEIIKVISHKECPVGSFFLYNALDGSNGIEKVPPA